MWIYTFPCFIFQDLQLDFIWYYISNALRDESKFEYSKIVQHNTDRNDTMTNAIIFSRSNIIINIPLCITV